MVLERDGAIRRCNRAAIEIFGPSIQEPVAHLASLWTGESSGIAAALLDAAAHPCLVHLQTPAKALRDFTARVLPVSRDGQSYIVLQLFDSSGAPDSAPQQTPQVPEPKASIKTEPVSAPEPAPGPPVMLLLDSAPWPTLLVQQNGMILNANRAACHAFGASVEKTGVPFGTLWQPDNGQSVSDYLKQASPESQIIRLRLKSGVPAPFRAQVCRVGDNTVLVQFFFHVAAPASSSEPSAAPAVAPLIVDPAAPPAIQGENAAYKQKLDCAMQLARSVALDFNNALTSILGHTSLLLSRADASHPFHDSLAEIEKSAARATEIANDLASFTRQEKDSRVQAAGNLNLLLERAMQSFRTEHSDLAWSLQLEKKLCTATFDEAKMQQAIAKIIENAVESMKPSGRVSLTTSNLELTLPTRDRNAKLKAGNYIVAEIADTGAGISPEALPRIFEPFFTTKGRNHRGLGLAWVYGIITNHGGAVAVSSTIGAGTSVRLYLPANKKVISAARISNEDLRGKETVLMVDDEDLMLTMVQTVLSSYGYSVQTANSGQKALDILASKKVDVMITDLMMPGMDGNELTRNVLALSPANAHHLGQRLSQKPQGTGAGKLHAEAFQRSRPLAQGERSVVEQLTESQNSFHSIRSASRALPRKAKRAATHVQNNPLASASARTAPIQSHRPEDGRSAGATAASAAMTPNRRPPTVNSAPCSASTMRLSRAGLNPTAARSANSPRRSKMLRSTTAPRPAQPRTSPRPPRI